MREFSRTLGDAVKRARGRPDLTQAQVASKIDRDTRTVINIENYKGNPKVEVLYPLIHALQIDSRKIFNPEMERETPSVQRLRAECDEQESATMIPVVEAVLSALRANRVRAIKTS